MKINRLCSIVILLLTTHFSWITSADSLAKSKTELLWPKGAPNAKGTEEKDRPKLTIYSPDEKLANGTAVVICPGGGYGGLAMNHEGHEIARWLNSFGVSGFICDYRHRGKGYGHSAPLQDAQRAIRKVRSRAKDFKIDPTRVGIMGFSAGGHLASTAATQFENSQIESTDPIDAVSCRPDFAILCYPVIAFDEPFTHRGSQRNLLGKNADSKLVRSLSNEKQVTSQSPPTFLWHTTADAGVQPENSVVFYLALKRAGVPAELHIYEKGEHGLGLAKSIPGTSSWPLSCRDWLRGRRLIDEKNNYSGLPK